MLTSRPLTSTAAVENAQSRADIPTAPVVLGALESFDALADVLAADPGSSSNPTATANANAIAKSSTIPADLVLSTTLCALRALGTLLSHCFAPYYAQASAGRLLAHSGSEAGSSAGYSYSCGSSIRLGLEFGTNTNTKTSTASAPASGVRAPLAALELVDASVQRLIPTVFSFLSQAGSQNKADDVLGWMHALVLAPLVSAFAPLSAGLVSVSLSPASCVGSSSGTRARAGASTGTKAGTRAGSSAGISYSANSPVLGRAGADTRADLRPAILALVSQTGNGGRSRSTSSSLGSSAGMGGRLSRWVGRGGRGGSGWGGRCLV